MQQIELKKEKLKKREIIVEGTYDEILTNLETDVRNYIKVKKKKKKKICQFYCFYFKGK